MNNVAYCPECLYSRMFSGQEGHVFAIANDHHLNTIAEGHKRWAGANAIDHELVSLKSIPKELLPFVTYGLLPTSGIVLGETEK